MNSVSNSYFHEVIYFVLLKLTFSPLIRNCMLAYGTVYLQSLFSSTSVGKHVCTA